MPSYEKGKHEIMHNTVRHNCQKTMTACFVAYIVQLSKSVWCESEDGDRPCRRQPGGNG